MTGSSAIVSLLGTHQSEANVPAKWANCRLFDPPMAGSFCDLGSQL